MPRGSPDLKNLGYYVTLAQVGLEMVIPIGIGAVLDHYLKWTPWGLWEGRCLVWWEVSPTSWPS